MKNPVDEAGFFVLEKQMVNIDRAKDSIVRQVHSVIPVLNEITSKMNIVNGMIDCGLLPDPVLRASDGRYVAPPGMKIFDEFPDNSNPCVYYFEFDPADRKKIIDAYSQARTGQINKNKTERRNFAAIKKTPPENTNVLYVGKSKKRNHGRLVVHLGYYDKGSTAGLQLIHWAREARIRLNYNVIYFPKELKDFVDPFEVALARELKPLIGML